MEKRRDIVDKAINELKNEPVQAGPTQQAIETTIAKLAEASGEPNTTSKRIEAVEKTRAKRNSTKMAAAAALLIIAGYAAGRLSAPRPTDVEQLQAVLEPAMRHNLLEEMKHRWQVAVAGSYVQLKDELSQQYQQDLNEFAVLTLAASNNVTNQLLEGLIRAINTANIEDRRWVAAALQQIELNRLQDKTQLAKGLESLAVQTGDELQRTREDMVRLWVNTQPSSRIPDTSKGSNINERSKK